MRVTIALHAVASIMLLQLLAPAAWAEGAPADTTLVVHEIPEHIRPVADHLWTITHVEENNKSVVAEFSSFLAVIESPGDEGTARAMLDDLAKIFPDKSVRFLLHTHYHGHSLAAIDPWLARDVTLVTSPANIERVQKRSANPERFEKAVLRATEGLTIGDGLNTMIVHVIDKEDYPVPTDEYTVIEFPAQGMLVSGCLYTKPLTYHGVVNDRKKAVHDFITDHLPDVSSLINTSSCLARGNEDVSSLATLDATLEEGLKPEVIADRLADMSLEEIDAALPDLTAELSARTERPYDLLVCANYLRKKREDLPRAEKLTLLCRDVFPDEPRPAYFLGIIRLEMGEDADAEEIWTTALALAEDKDEREGLEEAMERTRKRVAKSREEKAAEE